MFGNCMRGHGRRFARGEFDQGEGHRGGRDHGLRHPFGRGGHGRRRVFDQGELRFVMLRLIAERPRHGYEIIKAIEESLAGAYSPSPGVIYPTLTLLEELGYATVTESGGGKKLYTITADGQSVLEANRPTVDAIFQRMEKAGTDGAGGRSPQILRAIENLKLALRLRLSRGPLSEQQIQAIAAHLDNAARDVERT